ncbi:DUF4412 domain-containing protein [Luteirhabdus pelagi]|uniref:DUF4412 domain-containing protein n=1 Tax=Luteirhabdus pelagi TaxID=2792783 RepID=UPI00193A9283|nr:DUF4412 domain-containing protein [Luteirhabdus pelagi]
MKTVKLLLVVGCLTAFSFQAEAQFFKKLKKKVEKSVENTIHRKTADKASKETGEVMDDVLEGDGKENDAGNNDNRSSFPMGGMMGGKMENVPSQYSFEWVYRLKMEMKKERNNMELEYFLKEDAPYWGAKFYQDKQEMAMNTFMVYDNQSKLMVMFMNQEGRKMATASKMPKNIAETAAENSGIEDYTMKKIAGKTILGYDCDGFEIENDEYIITMYVTFDVPVSFSDVYGQSDKMPKGFNPEWLKKGDAEGLVMQMHMDEKNSNRNDMTMTCVKLEEAPFTISKSDYQTF